MHKSSMLRMGWFVKNYVKGGCDKKVLDVGSYNVNGCYKSLFDDVNISYVGLDIESGPNVDVVMDEIYSWNSVEDESFDYIISGQAFEHIEYPWLTIKEMYKKLKHGGIICIIAPNSLWEHKFPKDCYRYYGDGLCALAQWAGFKVLDISIGGIPERTVSSEWDDPSNDACLIACKTDDLDNIEIKRFPFERRFVPENDIMMQYVFLNQWLEIENKGKMLEEYLNFCGCKKVCIYGYEYIGKQLERILARETTIKYDVIKTKEKYLLMENGTEGFSIPSIELLHHEDVKKCVDKDTLLIITVFDHNRDYWHYINTLYPNSQKCYLYDLVEFMFYKRVNDLNLPLYLYGAGKYGRYISHRVREFGFNISGFVVSDGQKKDKEYCNIPTFELSEIDKNSAILVSVGNENEEEIVSLLSERGYNNVFDGKEGINTWKYSKEIGEI